MVGSARSRAPVVLLVLTMSMAGACAGSTLVPITPAPATPTPDPTPTAVPATPTPGPSASGEPATPAPPVEVALTIDTAAGAEDFQYATDTLSAAAGSKVTLTLNNKTDPDEEVGHNWVLVQPGQEESVLASASAAGDDNDWLDKSDPSIIAATGLIEGDDSDDVTFDAPPPGSYPFLCTFPEHFAGGMKGTLTIQ
jgi:azurin